MMVQLQTKQFTIFRLIGNSWQCLALFSGFGRCLIWEIDNIVEFIQICDYFTVNERFLIDSFQASFCEVLFTLKTSGYLYLACSLILFASSLEDGDSFEFDDLMSARSPFDFHSLIEYRLNQLSDD